MTTLKGQIGVFGLGNTLTVKAYEDDRLRVIAKAAISDVSITVNLARHDLLEALGAVRKEGLEAVQEALAKAREERDATLDRAVAAETRLLSVNGFALEAAHWQSRAEAAEAKLAYVEGERDAEEDNAKRLKDRAEAAEELAEALTLQLKEAKAELAHVKTHGWAVIPQPVTDAEATLSAIREALADPARGYPAIHAILNPPKPFELPTTVPARVEATRRSTGDTHVFYLWINGTGAINDNLWIDEDEWNRALTRGQLMDHYTDHRLIGEDQNHG